MKKTSIFISCSIVALTVIALFTASCSGASAVKEQDSVGHLDLAQLLPAFPEDYYTERKSSDIEQSLVDGSAFEDRSSGALINGSHMELTSIPGNAEYVVFRHEIGFDTALTSLRVDLSATGGDGAWVCIANYGTGLWEYFGPFTATEMIPVNTGGYLSTGFDNFFLAVIAYDGTFVDVTSSTLGYDNPVAPPSTYVDTMQSIFDANCMPCHSSGSGTAGIVLDSYWQAFDDADAALAKILVDHAPTGSGSMTTDEKDSFQAWVDGGKEYGEAVTYTNFVSSLTSMSCSPCHTGGGNSGGVNWDTYASSFPNGEAGWGQIKDDSMPQGGPPLADADKDKWLAWVEQGKVE